MLEWHGFAGTGVAAATNGRPENCHTVTQSHKPYQHHDMLSAADNINTYHTAVTHSITAACAAHGFVTILNSIHSQTTQECCRPLLTFYIMSEKPKQ